MFMSILLKFPKKRGDKGDSVRRGKLSDAEDNFYTNGTAVIADFLACTRISSRAMASRS
jgi:hypothetical protein